jgi:hypothetical protein
MLRVYRCGAGSPNTNRAPRSHPAGRLWLQAGSPWRPVFWRREAEQSFLDVRAGFVSEGIGYGAYSAISKLAKRREAVAFL